MPVSLRINRVANFFSIRKTQNKCDRNNISPGEKIGEGEYGVVWQDADNPGMVIKTLRRENAFNKEQLEEECDLFNKFYGAGSALLLDFDGHSCLKMNKLSGESMDRITYFPANALHFFLQMLHEMERKSIFHADLKLENVLYCEKENRFYPIDFSNFFELTLQSGNAGAQVMDKLYQIKKQELIDFINDRSYSSRQDYSTVSKQKDLRSNNCIRGNAYHKDLINHY